MSRNRLYRKLSSLSLGALALSATVLTLPAQTAMAAPAGQSTPTPRTAPAGSVLHGRSSNAAAAAAHLPVVNLDAKVKTFLARHHAEGITDGLTSATTACDANTPARLWYAQQTKRLNALDVEMVQATAALALPTLDAMIAPQGAKENRLTDHAAVLTSSLTRLHTFWTADTARTAEMVEMRNDVVINPVRVYAVYRAIGLTRTQASLLTAAEVAWVRTSSGMQHGHSPLLTFNSVATTGDLGHRRIVMGQGLMGYLDTVGDGDLEARLVLAHEYGHEVQDSIGMNNDKVEPTVPLASERLELHADASAGYVAAHAKGYHLDTAALKQGNAMFYSLGDCSTDAADHHGSPAQRDRAASWGEAQAAGSSTVLTPVAFRSIFDKALPLTIIPDTAA